MSWTKEHGDALRAARMSVPEELAQQLGAVKPKAGRAKITQDLAAEIAGVGKTVYCEIERGENSPRWDWLDALAEAFGGRLVLELPPEGSNPVGA